MSGQCTGQGPFVGPGDGQLPELPKETLQLVEQVRFDALFTFLFSPRVGTPAASLPDPMPKWGGWS